MLEKDVITILLNLTLFAGSFYAWYQFYKVVANRCDTCSIGLHKSPFKSKCFVGAVFFSVAFILALLLLFA